MCSPVNTLFGLNEGKHKYLDRLNEYDLLIIDAYIIECSGVGYEKYLSLKEGSAFKFRSLSSFDVR